MDVILLAENWPPRQGGIERYLVNISRGLPDGSVTVIAPKGSDTTSGAGIKEVVTKRFFWPVIKPAWWPLKRFTQKQLTDDTVILCGKTLFEGLLALKTGAPYIVFTYGMEIHEWAKHPKTKKRMQQVLQSASAVICINDQIKSELLELGVNAKDITKIYPGVEQRFFNAKKDPSVLEKYNLKNPYIVSIGRLIPRKGFDDLIEAFSKLDQVKFRDTDLVIIGDGPELDHLRHHAEQLFVKPTFLTNVPDEDVPALLAGATLFALTPKNIEGDIEGFGIVYQEAAAARLPLIGTRHGGVHEAIHDGVTGMLVDENNPEAIHTALVDILSNPEKAAKLADTAHKRAVEEMQWTSQSQTLTTIIQSIEA